jgi:hypothetical protein
MQNVMPAMYRLPSQGTLVKRRSGSFWKKEPKEFWLLGRSPSVKA